MSDLYRETQEMKPAFYLSILFVLFCMGATGCQQGVCQSDMDCGVGGKCIQHAGDTVGGECVGGSNRN